MAPVFPRHHDVPPGPDPAPHNAEARPAPGEPMLGWIPAAVGAAGVSALATWVLAAGFAVLGWLPGAAGSLAETLAFGTRVWLLAHGAAIEVGAARWSVAPLGLTLIALICLRSTAAFAADQAAQARRGDPEAVPLSSAPDADQRALIGRVVTVQIGVYLLLLLLGALVAGGVHPDRGALGGLLLMGAASLWGGTAGAGDRPTRLLPRWARALPRAVIAAVLVLTAGAAALTVISLIQHQDRVTAMAQAIGATGVGALVLLAVQVAYLPNVLIWAAAWSFGGGFTLGDGSVVSPGLTQLGLLPGVPILGALPAEGPGAPGLLLWLGLGVGAGGIAAAVCARARRTAGCAETCLVGGLAGLLTGLVLLALAAASGGDLGSNRLTGLGPRMLELAVMAPAVLVPTGLLVGLGWGLVRRRRPAAVGTDPAQDHLSEGIAEPDIERFIEPDTEPSTQPATGEASGQPPEVSSTEDHRGEPEVDLRGSGTASRRRQWWPRGRRRRVESPTSPPSDDEPTVVLD